MSNIEYQKPKTKSQPSTVKYGLGIFVRPPAAPTQVQSKLEVEAPAGVMVVTGSKSAFIHVPEGFRSPDPIKINAVGRANFVLVAGRGSDVIVDERASAVFRDLRADLHIAENSRVHYRALQAAPAGASDAVERRAWVGRYSRLEWRDVVIGGAFSQSICTTRLEDEGARVSCLGTFLGSGQQEFDICHQAIHAGPRTESELTTRGVLDDRAKAVYRSLIRINENQVGCTGCQQEDTLLLSEGAEVDAVPTLEIENEEVRCSHATTAGRLDDEKLFYLMSRGLDRPSAVRTYIEGFLGADADEDLKKIISGKLS